MQRAIQQLHSPFFSDSGDVEEGGTGGDSWKADGMRKKKILHVTVNKNHHKHTECLGSLLG